MAERKKEQLARSLQLLENRRQRFMDAYADGNLTGEELRGQLDRLAGDQTHLEDQLKHSNLKQEAHTDREVIQKNRSCPPFRVLGRPQKLRSVGSCFGC